MNIENTNERLQAAVNKEPHPSLYNRPNDLSKKLQKILARADLAKFAKNKPTDS